MRTHSFALPTLALTTLLGSSVLAQKPIPNVLSGDNLSAGLVRTGFKFGPAPVGGKNGSIALNRPGATHEKMQFARGKIPTAAAGGPDLSEILGFPHEHVQDIEPIGDWSKGTAYFAVTHSQDNSGHFFILKTTNVAKAPNEHEVFNDPTRVDGEGVYYEKYHQFAGPGQYNHPGDISSVGDILVIAGQNWPGGPLAKLAIGPKAAPDAVLFYNVADPEKPVYLGKIPIRTIAPRLQDISNLWAGKVGGHYYMSLGDGSRTEYFYSTEMSVKASMWKAASAMGVGFRGDTILAYRGEGSSTPSYLSVQPGVDDYQVVSVSTANAGAQLNYVGAVSTYDIEDSAFAARGSGSGAYVSKRGRMTQVSIDRGFRGILIDLESYSVHFGDRDVALPPGDPLVPTLRDLNSWNTSPSYYQTIQSCDLDGDGKAEILARASGGLLGWKSDGTRLPGTLPFTDAAGFANPSVYRTLQTADLDADGRDEVLIRTGAGLFAWSHTGSAWKQLPGGILLTNAGGFSKPEYYETIQTADLDGDGRAEVVARTAFGLFAWSFDGTKWTQLRGAAPLSDAAGFNRPQYYLTIQSADLNGDGRDEIIGRSSFGLYVYRHTGSAWVAVPGTINISDALGFDKPEYYATLRAADITGDGRDEVMIRFATGYFAYRYANGQFTQLAGIPLLSDANGFKNPGNWTTIQCADLDGDGRCEVLARYYWGLTASAYNGSTWQTSRAVPYVGDYQRYDSAPYASTMQTADLDGDGRADFLARLVTGLHAWSPDDIGFGRKLPVGVRRVGAPTTCQAPAPQLNVNARPISTKRGFRLISENAPASTAGVQAFAGSAWPSGVNILGANVHVNALDPAFFTLVIVADAKGRFDLPLPLESSKGVRFYTQSLWINPNPCSGRWFSATGALDIQVQ